MLAQPISGDDQVFFHPNQYLTRENEHVDRMFYVQEGWACRYRLITDGRRQITALYLPGDCCDPLWALGRTPSQPVVAITNVRAVMLPCHSDPASVDQRQWLWQNFADQCDRQTNWLVTLGRGTALERLAHLFLELFERMRKSGFAYGEQCALPLTQMDIADMTGLTSVHVNRTLQSMRAKGLIELHAKWLRIPDRQALCDAATLGADAEAQSTGGARRSITARRIDREAH